MRARAAPAAGRRWWRGEGGIVRDHEGALTRKTVDLAVRIGPYVSPALDPRGHPRPAGTTQALHNSGVVTQHQHEERVRKTHRELVGDEEVSGRRVYE